MACMRSGLMVRPVLQSRIGHDTQRCRIVAGDAITLGDGAALSVSDELTFIQQILNDLLVGGERADQVDALQEYLLVHRTA